VGDHRNEVRRELELPPDAPVVGNVAALAWHKAQKDLIAAMPALLEKIPAARLVIVGGGEEEDSLKGLVRSLDLSGRIVFTGPRTDVPRLLTAFDVFCMPSYKEGLCNSVLEAFAMGLPVVAADAGGLPEIVSDEVTGLLVPTHEPPAVAAALGRLLRDRELASRVAEAGRRLAHSRFGVDHMVDKTAALYDRLCSAGPGRAA